jgi:hypothetical protein
MAEEEMPLDGRGQRKKKKKKERIACREISRCVGLQRVPLLGRV